MKTYTSRKEFEKDNEARISKVRDTDFGCWWQSKERYPVYRISWVPSTGEFIVVATAFGHVHVTDTVMKTEEEARGFMIGWESDCLHHVKMIEDIFPELLGRVVY